MKIYIRPTLQNVKVEHNEVATLRFLVVNQVIVRLKTGVTVAHWRS